LKTNNDTQNLANQAYDFIKQKIISGEYSQGEVINITSIAQELNVSRTPITYAFKKLESEEIVTIIPKLGVQVKTMSFLDIKNTYEIRTALEVFAATKAINLMSNSDYDFLQKCIDTQKDILNRNELKSFWAEDIKFHSFIFKKVGNVLINSILEGIYDKALFMGIVFPNSKYTIVSIEEHEKALDCLIKKDEQGLKAILEKHIMTGYYSSINSGK